MPVVRVLVGFGRALPAAAVRDVGCRDWLGPTPTLPSDGSPWAGTGLFASDGADGHPHLFAGAILGRLGDGWGVDEASRLRTVPDDAEQAAAYRAIRSLPPAILRSPALTPLGIHFIRTA